MLPYLLTKKRLVVLSIILSVSVSGTAVLVLVKNRLRSIGNASKGQVAEEVDMPDNASIDQEEKANSIDSQADRDTMVRGEETKRYESSAKREKDDAHVITSVPKQPTPAPPPAQSETQAVDQTKAPVKIEVNVDNRKLTASNILSLINTERTKAGLPSLVQNSLLDQAAYNKSKDMADKKYFSHIGPDGTNDFSFVKAQGYPYQAIGSNIAIGDLENSIDLVDAWMKSPGHKENILATFGIEAGVGIYDEYFTFFIAKPR